MDLELDDEELEWDNFEPDLDSDEPDLDSLEQDFDGDELQLGGAEDDLEDELDDSEPDTPAAGTLPLFLWQVLQALTAPVGTTWPSRSPGARIWRFELLLSAGSLLVALITLYFAWWEPTWQSWACFWGAGLISFAINLAVCRRIAGGLIVRRVVAAAVLRDACLDGDDALAPWADLQPAPSATTFEMTFSAQPLFSGAPGDNGWAPRWAQVLLLMQTIAVSMQQLYSYFTTTPLIRAWQSLVVGLALPVFPLVLGIMLLIGSRPFTVTADGSGLTWRRRGRRGRLLWHEVRALGEVGPLLDGQGGEKTSRGSVYFVLGAQHSLAWWTWPVARRSPSGESQGSLSLERERDPAWELCQVIVARTGLPLRDVTQPVVALARSWYNVRQGNGWVIPEPGPFEWAEKQRMATVPRRRALGWLALVVAVAILVAGAGILLQWLL